MSSYRRILCPVDFAPVSTKSVKQALELAELAGAVVEVAHVCNVPLYLRPDLMVWVDAGSRPISEVAERGAREALNHLVASLPAKSRQELQTSIHFGYPAEVIVALAKERPFDLIVMGTHGRRGVSHFLLGSVAERVVRDAPCPVMVIRPDEVEET